MSNTNEEFSKAYVKYNKVVFAYLLKKIKNTQDAEDLTQKTFIRFFKSKFNAWDDQEYLTKYLLNVARNCYRNHVRFMVTNPARCFVLIDEKNLNIRYPEKSVSFRSDSFTLDDDSERNSDPRKCLSLLEMLAGGCDEDIPTHQAELNQLIEKLVAIIDSMPPKQKAAMIEVYINGLKPRDAAIKLNSKANRITFLIHKGKEQIKKKLTYV